MSQLNVAFVGVGTMARAMIDSFDRFSLAERPNVFMVSRPNNESLSQYIEQKKKYLKEKIAEESAKNSEESPKSPEELAKSAEELAKKKADEYFSFVEKGNGVYYFENFVGKNDKNNVKNSLVFLAVKPKDLEQAIMEHFEFFLRSIFSRIPIVSVMAGIKLQNINDIILKTALKKVEDGEGKNNFKGDYVLRFFTNQGSCLFGDESNQDSESKQGDFILAQPMDFSDSDQERYKRNNGRYKRMVVIDDQKKKERHKSILKILHRPLLGRLMPNLAVKYGSGVGAFCVQDTSQMRGDVEPFLEKHSKVEKSSYSRFLRAWVIDWDSEINHLKKNLEFLTQKMGSFLQVEEEKMNIVTALAGSTPAFTAVFVEALTDAAVRHGISRDVALKMAIGVLRGTADLVEHQFPQPADLKNAVSSPGGTTIEGLAMLEKNNFRYAVSEALQSALKKAEDLGK